MSTKQPTPEEVDAAVAEVLTLHSDATEAPWRWWTSNSFRRLSSDATGKDGDVLYGTIQRSDGHPDVVCSEADRRLIARFRVLAPVLALELKRRRERELATTLRSLAREVRHQADEDHPDRGRLYEIAEEMDAAGRAP